MIDSYALMRIKQKTEFVSELDLLQTEDMYEQHFLQTDFGAIQSDTKVDTPSHLDMTSESIVADNEQGGPRKSNAQTAT